MEKMSSNEVRPVNTTVPSEPEVGTVYDADAERLRSLGYEPQLARKFSWFQLMCSAFMATNSWLGLAGGFASGVLTGGTVCVVWGLVIVALCALCLACTLSELISAYPSAGGCYYWAMHLAPRRYSRISAYVTGWANLWGVWFCNAANASAVAGLIFACVRIYQPDVVFVTWHYFLLGVSMTTSLGIANLNVSFLSKTSTFAALASIVSFVFITITVPSASSEHTSAKFIFTSTENASGWSSTGMAFVMGLINASWCFGLLDASTHLAEEIPNPERNVPKAIVATVAMGFCSTMPMACALMYCMTDFNAVVAAEITGSPLAELIFLATGSRIITVISAVAVVFTYTFSIIFTHTYQCRLLWSFARDQGVMFSPIWTQVSDRFGIPLWSHLAGLFMNAALTTLLLASTTAFNSLITGGLVFTLSAGILPIAWSLWRGDDQKTGPFNLGRLGVAAKVVSLCYCLFTLVMYSFPFAMPVTSSNMNYITVFYGLFAIFVTADWWLRARKVFVSIDSHESHESHLAEAITPRQHSVCLVSGDEKPKAV